MLHRESHMLRRSAEGADWHKFGREIEHEGVLYYNVRNHRTLKVKLIRKDDYEGRAGVWIPLYRVVDETTYKTPGQRRIMAHRREDRIIKILTDNGNQWMTSHELGLALGEMAGTTCRILAHMDCIESMVIDSHTRKYRLIQEQ